MHPKKKEEFNSSVEILSSQQKYLTTLYIGKLTFSAYKINNENTEDMGG